MKLFGGKKYMTILLSVIVMGSVALSVNALSKLIFNNDTDPERIYDSRSDQDDDELYGDDPEDSWSGSLSGTESAVSDLVSSSTLLPVESAADSGGTSAGSVDLISSSTTKPADGDDSSGAVGSASGSEVDLISSPTVDAGDDDGYNDDDDNDDDDDDEDEDDDDNDDDEDDDDEDDDDEDDD
ncbi:MAG: hypothetical protein ACYC5K_08960 [Saccharofermentanales bacterium]